VVSECTFLFFAQFLLLKFKPDIFLLKFFMRIRTTIFQLNVNSFFAVVSAL
jgi:hypothetical protein